MPNYSQKALFLLAIFSITILLAGPSVHAIVDPANIVPPSGFDTIPGPAPNQGSTVAPQANPSLQAPVRITYSDTQGLKFDSNSVCTSSDSTISGKPDTKATALSCAKKVYDLMPFNAMVFSIQNTAGQDASFLLQYIGQDQSCFSVMHLGSNARDYFSASAYLKDPDPRKYIGLAQDTLKGGQTVQYVLFLKPECASTDKKVDLQISTTNLQNKGEFNKVVIQFSTISSNAYYQYDRIIMPDIGQDNTHPHPLPSDSSYEEPAVFVNNIPVKSSLLISDNDQLTNPIASVDSQSAKAATLTIKKDSKFYYKLLFSANTNVHPFFSETSSESKPPLTIHSSGGLLTKDSQGRWNNFENCAGIDYCTPDQYYNETLDTQENNFKNSSQVDLWNFVSEYTDTIDDGLGAIPFQNLKTKIRLPAKEAGSEGGIKLITFTLNFDPGSTDNPVSDPVETVLTPNGFPFLKADADKKTFKLQNWKYTSLTPIASPGSDNLNAPAPMAFEKVHPKPRETIDLQSGPYCPRVNSGKTLSFSDVSISNLDYYSDLNQIFYSVLKGGDIKTCKSSNPSGFDQTQDAFTYCTNQAEGHRADYIYINNGGYFLQRTTGTNDRTCKGECYLLLTASDQIPPGLKSISSGQLIQWKAQQVAKPGPPSLPIPPIAGHQPPVPPGQVATPITPKGPGASTAPPAPSAPLDATGLTLGNINKWPIVFSNKETSDKNVYAFFYGDKSTLKDKILNGSDDDQAITILSSKLNKEDATEGKFQTSALLDTKTKQLSLKITCTTEDCNDFDGTTKSLLTYLFDPNAPISDDSLSKCTASDDGKKIECSTTTSTTNKAPIKTQPLPAPLSNAKGDKGNQANPDCTDFSVALTPGTFNGQASDTIGLSIKLHQTASAGTEALPGLSFAAPADSTSKSGNVLPSTAAVRITLRLFPLTKPDPSNNKRGIDASHSYTATTYCNSANGLKVIETKESGTTCDASKTITFDPAATQEKISLKDIGVTVDSSTDKGISKYNFKKDKKTFPVGYNQGVRVRVYVRQAYIKQDKTQGQCSTPTEGISADYTLPNLKEPPKQPPEPKRQPPAPRPRRPRFHSGPSYVGPPRPRYSGCNEGYTCESASVCTAPAAKGNVCGDGKICCLSRGGRRPPIRRSLGTLPIPRPGSYSVTRYYSCTCLTTTFSVLGATTTRDRPFTVTNPDTCTEHNVNCGGSFGVCCSYALVKTVVS